MGKLEERENRVGGEPEVHSARKGRPKEERETKKRVSLSVLPSLYEDIQRIAYVQRRSASDLVAELLERCRKEHKEELAEYEQLSGGRNTAE